MKPVKVIFFDWGGTLACIGRQQDSLRIGLGQAALAADWPMTSDMTESLMAAFAQAELAAGGDPECREYRPAEVIAAWSGRQPRPMTEAQISRFCETLAASWVGSLDAFESAADTLRILHERGVRLGLVSNVSVPPPYCRQELDRLGFAPWLDFAVFSSGVGYRKPSPYIYEEALRQAYPEGRPEDLSEAVFVGDGPIYDVARPAELGMRTALVACKMGIWPQNHYEAARPDWRIDSVAELADLIF